MRPHRKLIVWQESIEFVKAIYELTGKLPQEEKYGLSSQLRRSAVSIAANIAEGAARQSDKEFIRFLFISGGSSSEVDTLLEICKSLNYFSEDILEKYLAQNDKISALLNGLRKSIEERVNKIPI